MLIIGLPCFGVVLFYCKNLYEDIIYRLEKSAKLF